MDFHAVYEENITKHLNDDKSIETICEPNGGAHMNPTPYLRAGYEFEFMAYGATCKFTLENDVCIFLN
jgi:hypothetical protein